MTIKKTVNYTAVESVTYVFDETEIRGALVALGQRVYGIDPHKIVPEFEIGYNEDGHIEATLIYRIEEEVGSDEDEQG